MKSPHRSSFFFGPCLAPNLKPHHCTALALEPKLLRMSELRRCSLVFAPTSIDALVGTGSDFHSHAIPRSRSNRTVLLSCSFSWGDAGSHSPLERGIQSNTCFLTFLNILDIRWIFVGYSSDLRPLAASVHVFKQIFLPKNASVQPPCTFLNHFFSKK